MGVKAVKALIDGHNQQMLAVVGGRVVLADFPAPEAGPRCFDDAELLLANQILCDM